MHSDKERDRHRDEIAEHEDNGTEREGGEAVRAPDGENHVSDDDHPDRRIVEDEIEAKIRFFSGFSSHERSSLGMKYTIIIAHEPRGCQGKYRQSA